MTYVAHTEDLDGLTLRIESDDTGATDSPVADDEAVRLVILHRRYANPGEEHGLKTQEDVEQFERECRRRGAGWIAFPVFMYDHSGTAYSIKPFACPWDSGRVGSIFLRKADFGHPYYKAAATILDTYTSWANGEVYGFIIEDEDGEHIDSCWGFIGDPMGYVLEEGRAQLAYFAKERAEERAAEQRAENEREARTIEAERPDLYCTPSA